MIQLRTLKVICVSLSVVIVATASSISVQADQKTKLAIVVAKGSPISSLSFNELKRLYLGSTVTGPRGSNLIGFNQSPDSPDRHGFVRAVLGMSTEDLGRYWIDRKIRGQSGPPKALGSTEEVRKAIARNPDAVGYLRINELGPEVKLIAIDGKDPKAAGYRIEY